MKTTLQPLLVLAGTLALAVCGNAQNLLTNGSFELPGGFPDHSGTYLTNHDTQLIGWTAESTGLIVLHNGTAGVFDFPPIDGTYHVSFNGADAPTGSSLSQSFDTVVGKDYLVSFYVGRLGGGGGDLSITATATSSTAQVLGTMTAAPPGHGYGGQQFFVFRATTPTSTLRLQDTSAVTGGVDLALDAVSVTALAAGSSTVTVNAYIDGRSQLVIRPDGLWWNHLAGFRPGRATGVNYSTSINSYAWYPTWPDSNDTSPSLSTALSVSAQFSGNSVIAAPTIARGPVTILQQPTAQNNFTLIVEFDDGQANGAVFYQVTLIGMSLGLLPVLSIQVASVGLSFPPELNRFYQLQYTPNLSTSNWIDRAAPIQGFGTNVVVTDSILGQPTKMYRVVPLP